MFHRRKLFLLSRQLYVTTPTNIWTSGLQYGVLSTEQHGTNDPTSSRQFTTMAVADDKLEPLGHDKVKRNERHVSQETVHLIYDLPAEWFAQHMTPTQKRERMVCRLSDWTKRECITPTVLIKLIQGPFSREDLRKYTSNQIARIVFAVGLMKKTNQLISNPDRIEAFVQSVLQEATKRMRLMTYDGVGLAQTAFGIALMQLEDKSPLRLFAEEATKPHRLRNTHAKSFVNLLDAFSVADYKSDDTYIEILSEGAIANISKLPHFALPKLLEAWGHFRYKNIDHVKSILAEILKEPRLNVLLASHIEVIIVACAKLRFCESKVITCFVRELIYSQKWKFMSPSALPRIVWALSELGYENTEHWRQILEAVLESDRCSVLEPNHIIDIYSGWAKIGFRDSRLLEMLGREMINENRMTQYSTRQLFEIYKAQRALGQVERSYSNPVVTKLRDTEKLMKCKLETKIKILLFANIKKDLGMKNVASLAKEIFQPMCLEQWSNAVLLSLSRALVALGPMFSICFAVTAKELLKKERLTKLDVATLCEVLSIWNKLEYSDDDLLSAMAEECVKDDRLSSFSEQQLLMVVWLFSETATEDFPRQQLQPLYHEIINRPLTAFTTKGLVMLLQCAAKEKSLSRDGIKPVIDEILVETKRTQLTPDLNSSLSATLLELGFEDEHKRLNLT